MVVLQEAKNCGSRKDKWPAPMCLYTRHTCHGTARRDIRIRNYVYMHGIPTIYPQKYCGPMAKDYGVFNPFAFTAEAPYYAATRSSTTRVNLVSKKIKFHCLTVNILWPGQAQIWAFPVIEMDLECKLVEWNESKTGSPMCEFTIMLLIPSKKN